jgi:hypothetical protein
MKKIAILVLSVMAVTPVHAIIYITNTATGAYTFIGQTNATNLTLNVSDNPNFTLLTELEKSETVVSSAAVNRFMASGWSTNSISTNQFFEFSLRVQKIDPIPVAFFDALQVNFALRRSTTGPRQFQWRSSLDDFTAPLTNFTSLNPAINLAGGVLTLPDTSSTETFGNNHLSLTGLSLYGANSMSLRLYAFQAESTLGQAGLDTPLGFEADVVVPEPTTIALIAFSAAVGALGKWRRRRAGL